MPTAQGGSVLMWHADSGNGAIGVPALSHTLYGEDGLLICNPLTSGLRSADRVSGVEQGGADRPEHGTHPPWNQQW